METITTQLLSLAVKVQEKVNDIISIPGTLLNLLFKTDFEVLSETLGSQTTMGIWTSIDKEKRLVIMDLEGTDSKQRGEDRLVYSKIANLNRHFSRPLPFLHWQWLTC